MESRPLIAELRGQDTLLFHDLEHCIEGASLALPGIHYLPDGADNNGFDTKHTKAFNRGHNATVKATDFFNRYGKNATTSIQAANSGLITGPPPDAEHSDSIHSAVHWFEKIQFHTNLTSTQYLHFSNPSLLSQDVSTSSINIISGICLFSGRVLASSIPSNEHGLNNSALEHAEPTLYELENIARIAPAIADVAALLNTKHGHLCRESNVPLKISLDIPNFHYYYTVEKRLRDGLCTFPEALQWMDAVEKRHYQVSCVFRRYTQHELVRRGCHGTHTQVSSSGTAGFVCDMLRQSLREGTLLSLDAALQRISAYDPIWTRFSDILPEKDKPRDFQGLGHIFVCMCKCRRALATIVNVNGRGGQNDNVLSEAGPSKSRIDSFGVMGMLYGGDVAAVLRKICMEEGLIS